ncbi:MAG: acyl-CoA dehydrogenase family protein [Trebonia sp.]
MLTPTPEQLDYQAEVRRLLTRSWPLASSRGALEDGRPFDPAAWSALTGLGATGLLVPAAFGGAGAGAAEAALVSEELGRVLLPVPYVSGAVTAARLLSLLSPDPARDRYLAGIASGATIATVAFLDDAGRWSPDRVAVRAEPAGAGSSEAGLAGAEPGGAGSSGAESSGVGPAEAGPGAGGLAGEQDWLLSGTVPFVADAGGADLVLVIGRTPAGLGVFAVEDTAALRPRQLSCLDPSQPLSRLPLDAVPARRLPAAAEVEVIMADVVATTIACLTASAVGGAERCLELSVEYAKTRVQFGKPIGSHQAIKHRCADMFAAVQSARSAVHHLLGRLDAETGPDKAGPDETGPDEETALAVSIAKAYCSDAFVRCARDTVQIHGGIGFTWEHDAHRYLRRAMAHAQLLGDATYHRQLIAKHLGVARTEAPPA